MQTVSFQCGHCHKTMGVSSAFLGKQVRCPHCQQVVTAPAQAPVPPQAPAAAPPPRPMTPPTFQVPAGPPPGRDEHESIFGEHVDDDLFGAAPKAVVELPPEPARNHMQLEQTVFTVPGMASGLPPEPNGGPAPAPLLAGHSSATVAPSKPDSLLVPSSPDTVAAPSEWGGGAAASGLPTPTVQMPARRADGGNMLPFYIIIFLTPYAIFMTAIAVYYYYQWRNAPNPLEMLPDQGEPKASKGARSQVISRISASTELPPKLRIPLATPFRIGDLEVTARKVEQKRLIFKARSINSRADPQNEESLVLHLDFKNISTNTVFRPTDSTFDYAWRDRQDSESVMPYTYLTVAGMRYCGPFPRKLVGNRIRSGDNLRDEFVEGQEGDAKILKPGETSSTVIVTEPKDQVPSSLRAHRGKLLWRVQLRRGLVKVKEHDRSATFVMGVEFDKDQIEKEK